MEKLEVTFRIVTPLFLGGAKPNEYAELRPPSIKGAMRFWYRAIDPEYKEHEAKIFGGSGKKEGQAMVHLRISKARCTTGKAGDSRWDRTAIPYLGYGLINREDKKFVTVRPYLAKNGSFTLTVLFKPSGNKEEQKRQHQDNVQLVKKALWAMIIFGGLGARSRKGFGSLAVTDQQGFDDLPTLMPKNEAELTTAIKDFIEMIDCKKSSLPANPAEHTCFSQDSRCLLTGSSPSAEEAFEWLADTVQACRSHRSSNHYNITKKDHDIMREFISSGTISDTPPKRAAFGLPHNYFFPSIDGRNQGFVDLMEGKKKGRRASPLFFKIHQFPGAKACVLATFLPARLIPRGKEITLTGGCNRNDCLYKKSMPLPDDFTAVTELLTVLGGKEVLHGQQ